MKKPQRTIRDEDADFMREAKALATYWLDESAEARKRIKMSKKMALKMKQAMDWLDAQENK